MGLCSFPSGNSPVGRTGALLTEWHPLKTLISLKFHKKTLGFQEYGQKVAWGGPGWLLSHTPLLKTSCCSRAGGEDGMQLVDSSAILP